MTYDEKVAFEEANPDIFNQQEEERERLTFEAIKEARNGECIDHETVQAWADSLLSDNPLPFPTQS